MPAKLLLAGYFGCGNLGDDAILLTVSQQWRGQLGALSGDPGNTHNQLGIRAWPRRDLNSIKAAIQEHDALVFPGGSVFQDSTSAKSVLYYANLVRLAKKANKKVIMVGQGVGPLTTFWGKRWARQAFQSADAIAVRDASSLQALKSLELANRATVTADLTFAMAEPPIGPDASGFGVGDMKAIGLAPRHFIGQKGADVLFGDLSKLIYGAGYVPVLIEMDTAADKAMLDQIEKHNGGKVPGIRRIGHPNDLLRRLMRLEAVVAVRLHAGILAARMGVPSVMVNYDPKVQAIASQLELPSLPTNNLTPERVLETLRTLLRQREQHVVKMNQRMQQLEQDALRNFEVIESVFGA